jgi:hypothetical protein
MNKLTPNQTLLLEYYKWMQTAEPMDRKPITSGYSRILELRVEAAVAQKGLIK